MAEKKKQTRFRESRYKIADVEAALRQTGGLYTPAARILEEAYGSCTRNAVKGVVNKSPTLQRALEDIRGATLDLAESQLILGIRDGNMTAIIFYLRTLGKHRGYVQQTQISGIPDGPPIRTESTTDISKLSPAGLAKLANMMAALEDTSDTES